MGGSCLGDLQLPGRGYKYPGIRFNLLGELTKQNFTITVVSQIGSGLQILQPTRQQNRQEGGSWNNNNLNQQFKGAFIIYGRGLVGAKIRKSHAPTSELANYVSFPPDPVHWIFAPLLAMKILPPTIHNEWSLSCTHKMNSIFSPVGFSAHELCAPPP